MRKNIVAGNWKMNKNLQEGIALAKELNEILTADKPNLHSVYSLGFCHSIGRCKHYGCWCGKLCR